MLQYTPLVAPLAFVTAMATVGLYFTWRKRDNRAETWMAGVFVCIALWAGLHLLLVSTRPAWLKRPLLALVYPIGIALPGAMLVFALHYTGRKSLVTRGRLAAMAAVPAAVLVMTALNPGELAFVGLDLVETDGVVRYRYSFGPGAVAFAAVGHLWGAAALYMLLLRFLRSRNIYRKLSFVLLVTTLAMLSASVTTFAGLSPFPHMALLPMVFLVFGSLSVLTTVSVRVVQLAPIEAVFSRFSALFGSLVPMARDVVIEELRSGVIVFDADDRIVDINSAGRAILAPDGRRVVGQRIADVVDREAFTVDGEFVFGPGTLGRFESVWIGGPDGDRRCYDISLTEVSSTGDAPESGRVALLHDITAQQRRERELARTNERLDDFADIVSHDLRNPVNVANGHLEMLADAADGAETVDADLVERQAAEIGVSHDRIEAIIDDVLVLAREGDVVEDPEPVDVGALVDEAWGNVDTGAATLENDLAGTTVRGDRASLKRAVENLLRNAVEHGSTSPDSQARRDAVEHGGDDLAVHVDCLADARGFYVADTGAGLPEEERDRLFEHGYTTSPDGTGFGLSIVAEIVEAHGWRVEATDGERGGARFEIVVGDVEDLDGAPATSRQTG
jgi:signal transduction histidine kinase